MDERKGIFAGDDPFEIAHRWLNEATATEINDPNAIALASVDPSGLPNVRMVLLKEITQDAFVFYTNYESTKALEIEHNGKAAFVMHWKSIARQVRVRGIVQREDEKVSDAYFASRSLNSRLGAWASAQSQPLDSRAALMAKVASATITHGPNPERPSHWGGYRIFPLEVEFWSDGPFRLHDRFRWRRDTLEKTWDINRLSP